MNTKKILLIIGFVLAVAAFSALIYFVFIRDIISRDNDNENLNQNQNVNTSVNGLPVTNVVRNVNAVNLNANTNQAANINFGQANTNQLTVDDVARGGLTRVNSLVTTSVGGAEPSTTGTGVRFYDEFDGRFYSLDQDGNTRPLSDQYFPNATEIDWSPVDDRAVISFPDQSKVIYDFINEQQVTLPSEWDDVSFSPAGDSIGFKNMSDNENERWLAVADTQASNVQLIEPLGANADDVQVNWSPNNQVIALYGDVTGTSSQEVLPLGLHGENFKSFEVNGRGFEGTWSPDGSQLLYSVYNADSRYNPVLYLVDASGDQVGANKIEIGLQTWVDRCAFSQRESAAYCAVPAYLPTGSGIYPEAAEDTNDSIYKINTNTGAKSIVALPSFFGTDRDYSITKLFLSNDGNTIYFNDQAGELFSLTLP